MPGGEGSHPSPPGIFVFRGAQMPTWTTAQRDALAAAIAEGVLTVTWSSSAGSRSVTYQSLSEMRSLLAEMDRQLSSSSRTFRVAATDKGV